jgi:large subunit ribosomal protein L17
MRHQKAHRRFGRTSSERMAMFRQLSISMILHERITTTEAKAKEFRPIIEKLITLAREDTEFHRRLVMSKINHAPATAKLFEVIAPRYLEQPGGYTRINKLGLRKGDAAPIALIELIER